MIRYLLATLLIISSLLLSSVTANTDSDNKVKALFLYNFANFVDWPNSAFESGESPLRLCLYGNIPFGSMLDAVDGTIIGKRVLKIVRATEKSQIEQGCHMLYVGLERKVELPAFFSEIKYMYVLSVGEREDFVDKGGVINIVRTSDQLKFDINISTAINNGLWVSSDLLQLARQIKKLNQ